MYGLYNSPFPMNVSDLKGHWPIGRLFRCSFSYICAAADNISADVACRAVPLL